MTKSKAVRHSFQKIYHVPWSTNAGEPRTLCNVPEKPTEWKSEIVTDNKFLSFLSLLPPMAGSRDVYASKKTNTHTEKHKCATDAIAFKLMKFQIVLQNLLIQFARVPLSFYCFFCA